MDTSAIQQFMNKVKQAKSYNSKEIRLTIQEAELLSTAIGTQISRSLDMANRVIDLQDQIMNGVEVKQDGGKF
jgi:hypothetical protein